MQEKLVLKLKREKRYCDEIERRGYEILKSQKLWCTSLYSISMVF